VAAAGFGSGSRAGSRIRILTTDWCVRIRAFDSDRTMWNWWVLVRNLGSGSVTPVAGMVTYTEYSFPSCHFNDSTARDIWPIKLLYLCSPKTTRAVSVLVLLSSASPSVLCCGEGLRLLLLGMRLGLVCLALALAALGPALAGVVTLTVSSACGRRVRLSPW
jgi:hypothetical protein